MNILHLLTGAVVALYFLFQHSINIPYDIVSYMILAWCVCIFLDLHSTLRSPSMMKHESNPLFSTLHTHLSWGSVPLQICAEIALLGVVSSVTADPFQTFGLACIGTGTMHVWYWHKNEIFRRNDIHSLKNQ